MKSDNRLRYSIKEEFLGSFQIWRTELRRIFRDEGVMIFFFLVPFVYPLLYAFIYNNEVAREARLVVIDRDDSFLSREFTRRVDATPDVRVVATVGDMAEARRMMDEKQVYGILSFSEDYSKRLHEGRQATVSLYTDMSALLFYKAFLLAATEVSLDMGKELRARGADVRVNPMIDPIPYESAALFNPSNGFASFLVPAILILVLQQTLILGIGMLGGTTRERIREGGLHVHAGGGTLRVIFGKSFAYLPIYAVVCVWVLVIVPRLFKLPQIGDPLTVTLFLLPYLLACIFLAMTLSNLVLSREEPMLLFVFTSVVLLFISGVSWPWSAVPPFWKAIGYLFPSTPGIQGFTRINTTGATLSEVAAEYRVLWAQCGCYFLIACLLCRWRKGEKGVASRQN